MDVLVTGALGALGRHTLRELLAAGHRVKGFELDSPRLRRAARRLFPEVEWTFGDIRSPDAVREALRGASGVIHGAAILPPSAERDRALTRSVNVGGTEVLIEAMKALQVPGPIVLSSSVTVHGRQYCREGLIRADSPLDPTDAYTEDKVACEARVRESGLPWTILRIGVVFDEGGGPSDADQLRMMFEVDPDVRAEVVHGRDAALAQARAVTTPEAHGEAFLIGGGPACRIHYRDLFSAMTELLQLGELPAQAFGRSDFYTGHMDTEPSQALFAYQRHGFTDILGALRAKYGWAAPALRVVRPLTRRALLQLSGPYRGLPAKTSWADLAAG